MLVAASLRRKVIPSRLTITGRPFRTANKTSQIKSNHQSKNHLSHNLLLSIQNKHYFLSVIKPDLIKT